MEPSTFRLQGRHLSLTYPRCPLDRKSAADFLCEKFQVQKYVVAREEHKDELVLPVLGTVNTCKYHLHVYLELKDKIHTRNPDFADILDVGHVYHGNYQVAKQVKQWVKYCLKEDADAVMNFDAKAFLEGKEQRPSKKTVIGEQLINNRIPLEELIPTNPDLIFGYKRLKLDINEYMNDLYVPEIRRIEAYWYYGPTRLGKSWKALCDTGLFKPEDVSGVAVLRGDYKKVYFKNAQNKWFDGYNGQDILFIDELPIEAAKWNINYLKQWTDTIPYQPEIKGAKLWARWTKVYVTCQHGIREYFRGLADADVDAIVARFKVINITLKQY